MPSVQLYYVIIRSKYGMVNTWQDLFQGYGAGSSLALKQIPEINDVCYIYSTDIIDSNATQIYFTSDRGALRLSLSTTHVTAGGISHATVDEAYFSFPTSYSNGVSSLVETSESVPVVSFFRDSSSCVFLKSSFSLGTPQFPYFFDVIEQLFHVQLIYRCLDQIRRPGGLSY